MVPKIHSTSGSPPVPAGTLERPAVAVSDAGAASSSRTPVVNSAGAPASDLETRRERFRRRSHRIRLHGYALVTVALVACVVALAAANTARVKVSWVFGTSVVSLVWLVLAGAILGWLLGMFTTARFRWRTRAPRRSRAAS